MPCADTDTTGTASAAADAVAAEGARSSSGGAAERDFLDRLHAGVRVGRDLAQVALPAARLGFAAARAGTRGALGLFEADDSSDGHGGRGASARGGSAGKDFAMASLNLAEKAAVGMTNLSFRGLDYADQRLEQAKRRKDPQNADLAGATGDAATRDRATEEDPEEHFLFRDLLAKEDANLEAFFRILVFLPDFVGPLQDTYSHRQLYHAAKHLVALQMRFYRRDFEDLRSEASGGGTNVMWQDANAVDRYVLKDLGETDGNYRRIRQFYSGTSKDSEHPAMHAGTEPAHEDAGCTPAANNRLSSPLQYRVAALQERNPLSYPSLHRSMLYCDCLYKACLPFNPKLSRRGFLTREQKLQAFIDEHVTRECQEIRHEFMTEKKKRIEEHKKRQQTKNIAARGFSFGPFECLMGNQVADTELPVDLQAFSESSRDARHVTVVSELCDFDAVAYKPAYGVVLDTGWDLAPDKDVVDDVAQAGATLYLLIRGTLDVSDVLTDLVAHTVPLESLEDLGKGIEFMLKEDASKGGISNDFAVEPGASADGKPNAMSEKIHFHEGMLRSAQTLATKVIPKLLEYVQEHSDKSISRLVITGHSLGGGTASLLFLLLKHNVSFQRVLRHRRLQLVGHAHACPATASANVDFSESIPNYTLNEVCQTKNVDLCSAGTTLCCACSTDSCDDRDDTDFYFAATVLGWDVVPRLSVSSVSEFRDHLQYLVHAEKGLKKALCRPNASENIKRDTSEKSASKTARLNGSATVKPSVSDTISEADTGPGSARFEVETDAANLELDAEEELFLRGVWRTLEVATDTRRLESPDPPLLPPTAVLRNGATLTSAAQDGSGPSRRGVIYIPDHNAPPQVRPGTWFRNVVLSQGMLSTHLSGRYVQALQRSWQNWE